jgi:hypothetical protein
MGAFRFHGRAGHRCRLAHPLGRCRVEHVGHRSILVRTHTLVSITAPGVGLAPYGYAVGTPLDFARLREAAADATELVIEDADWTEVDLTLGHRGTTEAGWDQLRSAVARYAPPGTDRAGLHSLGTALARRLDETDDADPTLVRHLVGAGPGSTPTGDDILVGLQAALLLRGRADAHARLSATIAPLADRTTELSRTLLAAAADGVFADFVIGLADAAGQPAHAERAAARAVRVGASTGLDTTTAMLHPFSDRKGPR